MTLHAGEAPPATAPPTTRWWARSPPPPGAASSGRWVGPGLPAPQRGGPGPGPGALGRRRRRLPPGPGGPAAPAPDRPGHRDQAERATAPVSARSGRGGAAAAAAGTARRCRRTLSWWSARPTPWSRRRPRLHPVGQHRHRRCRSSPWPSWSSCAGRSARGPSGARTGATPHPWRAWVVLFVASWRGSWPSTPPGAAGPTTRRSAPCSMRWIATTCSRRSCSSSGCALGAAIVRRGGRVGSGRGRPRSRRELERALLRGVGASSGLATLALWARSRTARVARWPAPPWCWSAWPRGRSSGSLLVLAWMWAGWHLFAR